MAFLVDTNVLVYRHDGRFPHKQAAAWDLLDRGLAAGEAQLAHQAVVELVPALTRQQADGQPLLSRADALREADELLAVFPILYPVEGVVRLAIRGCATYQLSWFDAHMWAYAEHYGIPVLYSEDFQHERLYGNVQALDPFR